jgi:hypothetical protein
MATAIPSNTLFDTEIEDASNDDLRRRLDYSGTGTSKLSKRFAQNDRPKCNEETSPPSAPPSLNFVTPQIPVDGKDQFSFVVIHPHETEDRHRFHDYIPLYHYQHYKRIENLTFPSVTSRPW